MSSLSTKELRKEFKKIYSEEFDDANEAFMDFLLDLIPKDILKRIIEKGNSYYYSLIYKYL